MKKYHRELMRVLKREGFKGEYVCKGRHPKIIVTRGDFEWQQMVAGTSSDRRAPIKFRNDVLRAWRDWQKKKGKTDE